MPKVRVLRIIEYVYPNQEAASKDMGAWLFPSNGSKVYPNGKVIRSTIVPIDLLFAIEEAKES